MALAEPVLLTMNRGSSPDDKEEVVVESIGFPRDYVAASTEYGPGEA